MHWIIWCRTVEARNVQESFEFTDVDVFSVTRNGAEYLSFKLRFMCGEESP